MTFSIVARDALTGALGVATATGGPVVGQLVPHARAGTGAIATQSRTNPHYGFDGLALLENPSRSAQGVLETLLEADSERDRRQCIIVDRRGNTAGWTGAACVDPAGDMAGDGVAVAGNMLGSTAVLPAMLAAYQEAQGALEDRLLAAMMAGEAAGGDQRGIRSAALKVYTSEAFPAIDLRADWSTAPLQDLTEILAAVRGPDYAGFFGNVPSRPR